MRRARLVFALIIATIGISAAEVAQNADPVLPPGSDNALIVEDLPGHLSRLLRSKPVQHALTHGVCARWLAGAGVDADGVLAKLENPALPVPLRIGISMPRQGWDGFAPLLGLSMRIGLLDGASSHPEESEAIAQLRGEALAAMRALRVPPLCVALDFRNPGMGSGLAMAFGGFLQQAGFQPERTAEATTYRWTVGARLDETALRHAVHALGLVDDADDDLAGDMATALAPLEVRIAIRPRPAGFQLVIGEWPQATADADADADAGTAGEPTFITMRWDIAGLQTTLEAAYAWWTSWDDTALGTTAKAADTEDIIGNFRRSVAQVKELSPIGVASMTVGDGDIVFVASGTAPASAETIGSQRLPIVAPPGSAVRSYDADADIGTWLGDLLGNVEERLGRQSFQAIVRDDEDRADALEAISRAYYQRFADLRSLVLDQHADFFLPGLVVVAEAGGRLEKLEIVRRLPQEAGIQATAVPVPAMALIGRPRSAGSGTAFVERLIGCAIGPLHAIAGSPVPDVLTRTLTTPAGQTATALHAGWLEALAADWRIVVSGDCVLHASEVAGWLVISTSAALTDRIHARIAAGDAAADIAPDAYVQGAMRGVLVADLLRSYVPLLDDPARLVVLGTALDGSPQQRASLAEMVTGLAELVSLCGDAAWIGRNRDGGRRFEMRARLAIPEQPLGRDAAVKADVDGEVLP